MTGALVNPMRAALVLGLLGASACSALTTMFAAPALQRDGPRPTLAGTPLRDWKGVVHCHSYLSHDSDGTVAEIVAAAHAARVDFVMMTDHQTDASIRDGVRGRVDGVLFVVGAEVRTPQGTVMAFPLHTPLRRWQSAGALVAEAGRQGAVTFLCHAENTRAWDVDGICGVEIVNLHAGALAADRLEMLLWGFLLPLRATFGLLCQRNLEVFAGWDRQLGRRHPFTPVGGNDAHANVRIFGPFGGTIGTYREVFLTLSTHVLAERLDEASLVEALRAGRTYVCFDLFGEGAGFDFHAEAGLAVSPVGATVTASAALRLVARAPRPGRMRLLCDGVVCREVDGSALDLSDPAPGVYRIEVMTSSGAPWIFSSSIRVLGTAMPTLSCR